MRTNDSSSGREQKISLALCLPSNRRAWRDVSSLGTRQNTTSELDNLVSSICFTSKKFDTKEGITIENFDKPNEKLHYKYDGGNHISHHTYTYMDGGLFFTISD